MMSGPLSGIHLWFSFIDEINDEPLLAKYLTLLPRIERDILQRFHFPQHKKRYLVGRALARSVIAESINIAPQSIVFEREAYGRPYIVQPDKSRTIDFNLSYTDGLVALALYMEGKVGVDVENINNDIDVMTIAGTYFSTAEREELNNLPDSGAQKERFYELWTLKEAYLKASGLGLNTSLNRVCCASIKRTAGPLQKFALQPDSMRSCQVGLFDPSTQHKAAICVCDNRDAPLDVTVKKIIPLVEESEYRLPPR